jgi:hypothetical protein
MEALIVIAIIAGVVWLASSQGGRRTGRGSVDSGRQTQPRGQPSKKPADVYRPRPSSGRRPTIVFPTPGRPSEIGVPPRKEALEGLHDAFTGAPLNPSLGLHQCTACKVYYHSASVGVLHQENASRCVACGSASVVELTVEVAGSSRGRDFTPDLVTLANFRNHFDRVVTFEGRVHAVRVSRRGSDYAVMFENKSWVRGLKLVFFRGAVRSVGGTAFINGLQSRTVRVRGLLINHDQFGPEIIISERGMILKVS